MGYHLAGFEVVGVDLEPQPRYPFEFHQADALTFPLDDFDVIAASPPCQWHSNTKHLCNLDLAHPDILGPMRARLAGSGKPYVIENVPGAPLLHPLKLDGRMFGLPLIRMRWFESNLFLMSPRPVQRPLRAGFACVCGHGRGKGQRLADWSLAMGIDWMTQPELAQAIPPAYTKFIGHQLAEQLQRRAAA